MPVFIVIGFTCVGCLLCIKSLCALLLSLMLVSLVRKEHANMLKEKRCSLVLLVVALLKHSEHSRPSEINYIDLLLLFLSFQIV